MRTIIKTIELEPIILEVDPAGQEIISYRGKAAIDDDGSMNIWHDPCWQPETSLKQDGKDIDAEKVPYIAVPPAILHGCKGIVLGCLCMVINTLKSSTCLGVTAEIGPHEKLGEMSPEMARRLGLNPSATSGGTAAHIIKYVLWPGKPAVVDGITYQLQPAPKKQNG